MTREKELFERIRELQERNKELERKLGMYQRIMFGRLEDKYMRNGRLGSALRHILLTIYTQGMKCKDGTHEIGDYDIAGFTGFSNLTVANGIRRLLDNGHIDVVTVKDNGDIEVLKERRRGVSSIYRINMEGA